MRLRGPVFGVCTDPGEWAAAVGRLGYSAAYCPVGVGVSAETVRGFGRAANQAYQDPRHQRGAYLIQVFRWGRHQA